MSYTIAGTVYPWDVSGTLTSAKIQTISNYANITSIILPNTVTEIANNAFYLTSSSGGLCSLLNSITMPGVTTIGTYSFFKNTALADISMSNVITVGDYAFSEGITITPTSIQLPLATTIGKDAFAGCTKLTSIQLPLATYIGIRAFAGCTFTSIQLPLATTLDTDAFRVCTNLTSIQLPLATTIGQGTFTGCTNLTSVQLSSVITINSLAFDGCIKIASIQLPSVKTIKYRGFNSNTSLVSVYMPVITTLDKDAFEGCNVLKNIHINSGVGINDYDRTPANFLGSSKMNDFFITTDNASVLSVKLNSITTTTSNLTASRIRMEYNPTSKSAAGDMVLTHSSAIDATQYGELLTTFTGTEPTTGIHKTIYDNLNGIKTGLLLNAYNANSELDANYSDISFNLAPHYKNFNTYINTTSTFIPGATTQPDTTELIMTFANGTFSKKLVYKLNK